MFERPGPLDFVAIARETLASGIATASSSASSPQNRGGPRFSFLDGPITANNPMGVHHAWGRTLQGRRPSATTRCAATSCRYQNGFDCQGLWVEVEVERALGLQRQARHRGVRARATSRARAGSASTQFAQVDREQSTPARPVDGLGQLLLHLYRRQHRAHLALPPAVPRARLPLRGPSCPAVVHALRHRSRSTRCSARTSRLEHLSLYVAADLLDGTGRRSLLCGRRRRGRCPRTWPPPSTRTLRLRGGRAGRAPSY